MSSCSTIFKYKFIDYSYLHTTTPNYPNCTKLHHFFISLIGETTNTSTTTTGTTINTNRTITVNFTNGNDLNVIITVIKHWKKSLN